MKPNTEGLIILNDCEMAHNFGWESHSDVGDWQSIL